MDLQQLYKKIHNNFIVEVHVKTKVNANAKAFITEEEIKNMEINNDDDIKNIYTKYIPPKGFEFNAEYFDYRTLKKNTDNKPIFEKSDEPLPDDFYEKLIIPYESTIKRHQVLYVTNRIPLEGYYYDTEDELWIKADKKILVLKIKQFVNIELKQELIKHDITITEMLLDNKYLFSDTFVQQLNDKRYYNINDIYVYDLETKSNRVRNINHFISIKNKYNINIDTFESKMDNYVLGNKSLCILFGYILIGYKANNDFRKTLCIYSASEQYLYRVVNTIIAVMHHRILIYDDDYDPIEFRVRSAECNCIGIKARSIRQPAIYQAIDTNLSPTYCPLFIGEANTNIKVDLDKYAAEIPNDMESMFVFMMIGARFYMNEGLSAISGDISIGKNNNANRLAENIKNFINEHYDEVPHERILAATIHADYCNSKPIERYECPIASNFYTILESYGYIEKRRSNKGRMARGLLRKPDKAIYPPIKTK